ncbi:hypothetical protein EYF80_030972 [Liparis tanakae]|uniref:Uncharacterized protein n=1 Tax=Liparis tanakae TaxID=230148 RepID=A0A4Z2H166_9TELE|nr:hypothetical protein EYF80_030972 [Liparis tanakae]
MRPTCRTMLWMSLSMAERLPLPLALAGVHLDLPLRLAVDAQQAGAQDVVQAQEDVPVVVDEEHVVGVVGAAQLLGRRRAAEQQLGLGGAGARQAVGLLGSVGVGLGGVLVVVVVLLVLVGVLLLHVGELAAPREQHVGDEVVDDLLDLVLVLLLDAHLPLHVVDDERRGVLQDLAVVVALGHVRAARRRRGGVLRRSLLALRDEMEATMGTDAAGFFLSPSMMSCALSPYILWMALRWMTSEEPPIELSSLKRSCSSADMRDILRCTVSRARIVERLASSTTSSWRHRGVTGSSAFIGFQKRKK